MLFSLKSKCITSIVQKTGIIHLFEFKHPTSTSQTDKESYLVPLNIEAVQFLVAKTLPWVTYRWTPSLFQAPRQSGPLNWESANTEIKREETGVSKLLACKRNRKTVVTWHSYWWFAIYHRKFIEFISFVFQLCFREYRTICISKCLLCFPVWL